ncbi:IS66 family insertion sequence element accessory protein TnpB [Caballeronia sp.]|uniref:IS66 family insertion sequence element accessory protein TnpB n=1 Tax=Caballeronia sp. TaxID=1931223 RepID=UPI003C6FF4D3
MVEQALGLDPFAPTVYAFTNKRRGRVRLFLWDHSGFWLLLKRLEADPPASLRCDTRLSARLLPRRCRRRQSQRTARPQWCAGTAMRHAGASVVVSACPPSFFQLRAVNALTQ